MVRSAIAMELVAPRLNFGDFLRYQLANGIPAID